MNKQITINYIVGLEPFNIYLCDNTFNNCMYIDTLTYADIPYNFLVPSIYLSMTEVGVKAIDYNGCNIINTINI